MHIASHQHLLCMPGNPSSKDDIPRQICNDAVQMSFDGDDGEDDEGSNENEDDDNDDLDNSREEIEIVDDSANVAPQNLVSLIASISTWRRNLAPSD